MAEPGNAPRAQIRGPFGLTGSVGAEIPALDLALTHALLLRASRGELEKVVRVYRPPHRLVVFGRRDTKLPGFASSLDACEKAGFASAVRVTGGRAVAYTDEAVVIDVISRDPHASSGQQRRFIEIGRALVRTLADLGIDARLGPVPGEYCPGAHSINARGVAKLVGTAQRVVRDAWLFSALVVVDNAELLRPLLSQVYGTLDLPFEGASVGAVNDESGGAIRTAEVERALIHAFAPELSFAESSRDISSLAEAHRLLPQHRAHA